MSMQMDVQEVKQKMNSLLGSFRREKSKIRKSMERSNGTYGLDWNLPNVNVFVRFLFEYKELSK